MPLPWWSSSSFSPSSSSPTSQHRRLTRAKQIRHLRDCDLKDLDLFLNSPRCHRHSDDDADFSRSASSPLPHPLPLPGADEKSKLKSTPGDCGSFRLPSPTGAPKERETPFHKPSGTNARVAAQHGRRSVDAQRRVDARRGVDVQTVAEPHRRVHRVETWSAWNVPQAIQGAYQSQENLSIDIPFRSAPQSANSSPMVSPHRMLNGDPFFLYPLEPKPWSEPAMPTGFPYTALPQGTMVSRDSSSYYSPLVKSPIAHRKSTSGPSSPRHPKLSIEISSTHHDSNFLINGHPLPLPPTPPSSAQTSVPQGTAKLDFLPFQSQWSKGKLIGRGTFGSVYVATNRETGALCAMKEVELFPDDPKSAECIGQLEQEIKVLSHLKHPNIVQYYGSEIVDDKFYIYLEYVYPGSINKYVREHCGAITEAVVRSFTRHILSGLAYLHGRKTVHRDIKGANLLVDAFGVVKLADFGMAKHLTGQAADLSLKGSPYWMAPELMQAVMQKDNSSDLAFAVDIWSLGCTIIEMLTGKPPWSEYEGAAAMFKVLKELPPMPETLSPEGKDFLHCCFQRNPADRPPASKLLDHPFLRTSQPLDASSSSLAPSLLNQSDKITHSPREMYDPKFEKVPMSPSRWTANSKGCINETSLLPHLETSDLTVGSRHSPRSILEPATSPSPPRFGPTPNLVVPASSPNGMNLGAEKISFSRKIWK